MTLARFAGGDPWARRVPASSTEFYLGGAAWSASAGSLSVTLLAIDDETNSDVHDPFLVAAKRRGTMREGSLLPDRRTAWRLAGSIRELGLQPVVMPADDRRFPDGPILRAEPNIKTAGQVIRRYISEAGIFEQTLDEAIARGELRQARPA